ncbi:High-affinity nicotinic acid transporter [Tolypocladium paradoxum]|uniref:High-affinity nicotinic acid transporter n=1 Tax=Tolypocladium paradoxum TaxID=94208 RepID=A0A2S4KX32_9HYPO|nr:High-affinity nicotinic acid transporter [Tolypocladium paradoxum]
MNDGLTLWACVGSTAQPKRSKQPQLTRTRILSEWLGSARLPVQSLPSPEGRMPSRLNGCCHCIASRRVVRSTASNISSGEGLVVPQLAPEPRGAGDASWCYTKEDCPRRRRRFASTVRGRVATLRPNPFASAAAVQLKASAPAMSVSKSEQRPSEVASLPLPQDAKNRDSIDILNDSNLRHAAERGQVATDK